MDSYWLLKKSWLLGFAGGRQTLRAYRALYLDGQCRIPALYASPGSHRVAEMFGALSKGWRSWDVERFSIIPTMLSTELETDTFHGPDFFFAATGSVVAGTGYIAEFLAHLTESIQATVVGGRTTVPHYVNVTHIGEAPGDRERVALKLPKAIILVPIVISIVAVATCLAVGDLLISATLVTGMIVGGYASSSLRTADLTFFPPTGSGTFNIDVGDGYIARGREFIVLKGSAAAVRSVIQGRFVVHFERTGNHSLETLAAASRLLLLQCMLQVILIPMGSTRGQIVFLATMVMSWLFNAYIVSQEEAAWKRLVADDLFGMSTTRRWALGTRTAAAVFMVQMLKPVDIERQLAMLVPGDDVILNMWRKAVALKLAGSGFNLASMRDKYAPALDPCGLQLLETLLEDAQVAVDAFHACTGANQVSTL